MSTVSLSRPPLAPPVVSSSSSSSSSSCSSSSSSSSSGSPLPFCGNSILARCVAVVETCGFRDFPFEADRSDASDKSADYRRELACIRNGNSQSRKLFVGFEPLQDRATSRTHANYLFLSRISLNPAELNNLGETMDEELGAGSLSKELPRLNKLPPQEKQKELDDLDDLVRDTRGTEFSSIRPYSGHGYASICHYIAPFYLTGAGHFSYDGPHPTVPERSNYSWKGFCYSEADRRAIDLTFNNVWTRQGGEGARVENVAALLKEMQPDFPQPLLDLMAAYDGRIFLLKQ